MSSDSTISAFDAFELAKQFQLRTLSPVSVLDDVLARAGAINPVLNAFTLIDVEKSKASAKASELRWKAGNPLSPIDGVPVTIKDLLECRDWPTSYGSHVLAKASSAADAPAVARLKEAGAVLIGMTATPELGWKGVTDSPRGGITRNPWNPEKTPGGSSGGAAVAAALNLGCLHIGTDGGGSIRMPAAFTGIFGLKPTFGRVPAYPASVFGTVAHVGPMTRTVRDAVTMLNVLSKPDPRDWFAGPVMPELKQFALDTDKPLRNKRIAYSPDLGYMTVSEDVIAAVKSAVTILQDLGAVVEEVKPPFENPQKMFETHWFSAAAHRISSLTTDETAQIDPGLREAVQENRSAQSLLELQENVRQRADLGAQMSQFMASWDALVTPSLPFTAFDAGLETPSGKGRWTDWAGFNFPFNLTQQPSASIQCGLCKSGLPIGMQITAGKYQDGTALEIAAAFEVAHPPEFILKVPQPQPNGGKK